MEPKTVAFDEQLEKSQAGAVIFCNQVIGLSPSVALTMVQEPWELEVVIDRFHFLFPESGSRQGSLASRVERMLRHAVPDATRRDELKEMLWFAKQRCGAQWDYDPDDWDSPNDPGPMTERCEWVDEDGNRIANAYFYADYREEFKDVQHVHLRVFGTCFYGKEAEDLVVHYKSITVHDKRSLKKEE